MVLKGVSFDLEEGEILGIVGTNGSGKTTLFNIITMGLKRESGMVKLFGKNLEDLGPSDY